MKIHACESRRLLYADRTRIRPATSDVEDRELELGAMPLGQCEVQVFYVDDLGVVLSEYSVTAEIRRGETTRAVLQRR